MRRLVVAVCLSVALGAMVHADLIPTVPTLTSGSGIGLVNTVLTVQRTPQESGCVAWGGGADVTGSAACPAGIAGGDEKLGASQTQTRTLAQLGITQAIDLRIVLNPVEPAGDSITLDRLVLRIFSPAGAILFESSIPAPITFPFSTIGTGTSGFVFRMDDADALAAAAAFANPNNRVGLSAQLSSSAGGNETFYVTNSPGLVLCPAISIAPAALPTATVGVPYSEQLTAAGGTAPYTFSLIVGTLPEGLSLSTAGLIAGTPAVGSSGSHTVGIRATDMNGCLRDQEFQLVVAAPVPVLPPVMLALLGTLLLAAGAMALRRRTSAL